MSISQKSSQQSHEAILFFAGAEISHEMLYAEFEALLDCVVPIRDFAGKEMRAAYVRLERGLQPSVVVLFLIPFDPDGFPEQRWNLPLRQLAEATERSTESRSNGVRLASRSQCPLPGWERALWDVEQGPGGSTIERMRDRLGMNRLGLDDSLEYAPTAPDGAAPAGDHAPAATLQSLPENPAGSPDAMLALIQQSNLQINLIRDQSQREIVAMRQRLTEAQQALGERESARDQGTQALQLASEGFRNELETLRSRLDAESAAVTRLSAREIELQQSIALQERSFEAERAGLRAELSRQEEQVHSLSTELTGLRRDKLRLMDDGAESFFAALKDKNVNFVTFQPGAGHMTIPMEDLPRFLEETDTYVAAKCNVAVEHYRRWLLHYGNPVCQGTSGGGAACAKPVPKILKPSEFTSGLQDRCPIHKQVPRSASLQDVTA